MSLSKSYVDLFRTDTMDEKIKNSFNSTTDMLTLAYSRSMPDLSSIKALSKPTLSTEGSILPSQTAEQAVRPNALPALAQYHAASEVDASKVPNYGLNLKYDFTEYDKIKQENAELKHKRQMNLTDMLAPENKVLSITPGQELPALSPRYATESIIGADSNEDWCMKKDDDKIQIVNRNQGQRRRSIADEYKRYQVEMAMNDQYNRVYSNYDIPLTTRDSLDSFRLNSNPAMAESCAKSIHSLDTYMPPQYSDNDRPLSEPPKPANTRPIPTMKSGNSYEETLAARYPNLQRALNNTSDSPLFHPGFADETKQAETFYNGQQSNDIEKIQRDKVNQREEQRVKSNAREDQNKHEPRKNHSKKSSYVDLQSKREEMKKQTTKRVKKKTKPNKQGQKIKNENVTSHCGDFYCCCSDEEPIEQIDAKESYDDSTEAPSFLDGIVQQNPYLKHLYNPQPGNKAPVVSSQSNASLNKYEPIRTHKKHLQEDVYRQSLSDSEQNKKMYQDCPLTQQYFADASGYQPMQDETYSQLYNDSPHAQKYFSENNRSHHNVAEKTLPPLKPKSSGGIHSHTAGYMSDHTAYSTDNKRNKSAAQVDPLAFKLSSTNQEEYLAKKHKMLRKKEYAEFLRQHQQEMPKPKPQVRSWNVKSNDEFENEYQQSKRNAALNYAREIPKPVVAKPRSPPSQLQNERENAIDAIEVMKKRHDEDKRAIEEMRARLNMRVAQATA